MADAAQTVAEAVVSIIEADAGIQAITGRTERSIRMWSDGGLSDFPVLVYFVNRVEDATMVGQYNVGVSFSALARSQDVANALIKAALDALSFANFVSVGLDAIVVGLPSRSGNPLAFDDDDELARSDASVTIWATVP